MKCMDCDYESMDGHDFIGISVDRARCLACHEEAMKAAAERPRE